MFRKVASKAGLVGFALVCGATAAELAACSSSSGGGGSPSSAAGATAQGGTGSAAAGATQTGGGATGTAGAATGTAGAATGTAGTSTGTGFACAGTTPTSALFDFSALMPSTPVGQFTFMAGVPGGSFTYTGTDITASTTASALEFKGTVMNYDGFGLYFNGCTDASAYTGIAFDIKGNVGTMGTLNFRFQTNATTAIDTTNMKGSCVVPAGSTDTYTPCHPGGLDIMVTAAGATVTVPFSGVMGGVPVATVDGKDLVGIEWAFNWTGATDTAYAVDVTIDNVHFTGGTGTGTGGAGGASAGGASAGGTGGTAAAGASAGGTGGTAAGGASAGGTGGAAGGAPPAGSGGA